MPDLINWKAVEDKDFLINFSPASLIYARFWAWDAKKMLGAMKKWSKWYGKDDVRLPDIKLGDIAFENVLSIRV